VTWGGRALSLTVCTGGGGTLSGVENKPRKISDQENRTLDNASSLAVERRYSPGGLQERGLRERAKKKGADCPATVLLFINYRGFSLWKKGGVERKESLKLFTGVKELDFLLHRSD